MNTLFDDFQTPVVAKASDEYYTPKWVFDALGLEFDLDVCAPREGPLHTPAAKWYSAADDGLLQPWFGLVWMNPPYSNPTPWIDRWLEHGNGICLVPVTRGRWCHKLWTGDTLVVPTPPDMKFVRPDGTESCILWQTYLWAVGPTSIAALRNAEIGRVR